MVTPAATERAGTVGPGAVLATVASCSTSKALSFHSLDEVVEGAAIGSNCVGPGSIHFHSHRVGCSSLGLWAWGIASGAAIVDGVVPLTSQVDELLEGGGFFGELCNAQPFVYRISKAILKLVFKVTI